MSQQSFGVVLEIQGKGAVSAFEPEAGGHRFQRIPPTERNGRRQSSTVTVAVFTDTCNQVEFDERDVEYRYCIASVGAGGQNRQKNETACLATHKPTGITAKCEDERSRERNRSKATATLRSRVLSAQKQANHTSQNNSRRIQIGRGERGDKVRTVQMHNGTVTNHLTGKKMRAEKYIKGFIEDVQ
jgi:peptide chain release factor 1